MNFVSQVSKNAEYLENKVGVGFMLSRTSGNARKWVR